MSTWVLASESPLECTWQGKSLVSEPGPCPTVKARNPLQVLPARLQPSPSPSHPAPHATAHLEGAYPNPSFSPRPFILPQISPFLQAGSTQPNYLFSLLLPFLNDEMEMVVSASGPCES